MIRIVSLLVSEAQLAGCMKYGYVVHWSGTQASHNYVQSIIQDTVYEANVNTAIPDWCVLLSRPEIGQLCAVFGHQHPILNSHVASVVCCVMIVFCTMALDCDEI